MSKGGQGGDTQNEAVNIILTLEKLTHFSGLNSPIATKFGMGALRG